MEAARIGAGLMYGYAVAGLVFSLWFVIREVDRFDAQARGTGWAFRALIVPGSALLWPLLAVRVWRRSPHD